MGRPAREPKEENPPDTSQLWPTGGTCLSHPSSPPPTFSPGKFRDRIALINLFILTIGMLPHLEVSGSQTFQNLTEVIALFLLYLEMNAGAEQSWQSGRTCLLHCLPRLNSPTSISVSALLATVELGGCGEVRDSEKAAYSRKWKPVSISENLPLGSRVHQYQFLQRQSRGVSREPWIPFPKFPASQCYAFTSYFSQPHTTLSSVF